MNKKFLEEIQKQVINLLKTSSEDLKIASKNQCSEIARLVGCWILERQSRYKVTILKGKLSDGSAHDILAVQYNKNFFLIDPTIWQIFPKSDSVFIGSVNNMTEVISLVQKKYGGVWEMSEIIREYDKNYQQKLLAVIKDNCKT